VHESDEFGAMSFELKRRCSALSSYYCFPVDEGRGGGVSICGWRCLGALEDREGLMGLLCKKGLRWNLA
jgi:hypothetical protein